MEEIDDNSRYSEMFKIHGFALISQNKINVSRPFFFYVFYVEFYVLGFGKILRFLRRIYVKNVEKKGKVLTLKSMGIEVNVRNLSNQNDQNVDLKVKKQQGTRKKPI